MTERKSKRWLVLSLLAAGLASAALTAMLCGHLLARERFSQISGICTALTEKMPEAEQPLLEVLKDLHESGLFMETDKDSRTEIFLERYGYREADFAGHNRGAVWILAALCGIFGGLCMSAAVFLLQRKKRERIAGMTAYLERVNCGSGELLQAQEDDFSALEDELYKTVTALRQTREEAVRAKERFADNLANIAHQLKTPITAASLSLQRLCGQTDEFKLPESMSRLTRQVQAQLDRLTILGEALLTLARIDSGTLQLKQESVDAFTVLMLAAENLESLLSKQRMKVSILENGSAEFTGDLEWTMEALMNLIKNCAEHTPEGGTITCTYEKNPLYTEIRICDEGEGFAREDIPHLFERFYRGKCAKGEGIGIGLSLAGEIFALQNGSLTAKNLPEGGACFEVRVYA